MKYLARILILPLVLLVFGASFAPLASAQQKYGRDTYGKCTYGACNTHTIVQTPVGLKVAINLTDGQILPRSGYTVTITPLNGAGSSFQKALIYIDGVLVATVTPAANGTATWFWDTQKFPGENISFEIIDSSGKQTDQKFTVTIESENTPAPTDTSGGTASGGSGGGVLERIFAPVSQAFSAINKQAEAIIRKLPAPVVYVFPYLLFILMVVQAVILLLQTKRELKAMKALDELSKRMKEIGEMKGTFVSLLQHYLRTPFTILQGGAEMLTAKGLAPTITAKIKQHTTTLKQIIESTVQTTSDRQVIAGAGAELSRKLSLRKALTYGLLGLSLFLLVFIAFWFVYIANKVTSYDTGTIGIMIQFLLFSTATIVTFQIFRRLQLHKTEVRARQLLQKQLAATNAAKDSAIETVANQYGTELQGLQDILAQLPADDSTKFLARGVAQLSEVQQKFVAVRLLKGSTSMTQPQQVEFRALCGSVLDKLDSKIQEKNITVEVQNNVLFGVREPELLATVLQSLIDNAIGYSPAGSTVTILAVEADKEVTLTVTDQGRGIPADADGKIFQAFYKSEGADDFTHEGMGFSLYLDRLIMEYIHGAISLKSEPGKGTKAIVTIPAS